jgi:hypothetical protein
MVKRDFSLRHISFGAGMMLRSDCHWDQIRYCMVLEASTNVAPRREFISIVK